MQQQHALLAGLTGGLAGYEVAPGFDLATGWGSVDVAKLVAAAANAGGSAAASASTGSFTMGTSGTSLSVSAGATSGNAMTVFATGSNGFAGVVSVSCSVTAQSTSTLAPGCVVSPAMTSSTAVPSGSATVTVSTQAASSTGSSCGSGGGAAVVRLSGLAFAGICVLLLPAARRRDLRGLLMVIATAAGMSVMTGCGGGATAAATTTPSCAAQATGKNRWRLHHASRHRQEREYHNKHQLHRDRQLAARL